MNDIHSRLPKAKKYSDSPDKYFSKNLLAWKDSAYFYSADKIPLTPPYSHQWFNTHLRLNNICDIEQIEVPGSIILLPWGHKICERFIQCVREEIEKENDLGYQEYAYPSLIPQSYFNPMNDLINIEKSLLNVQGDCHLALSPTGEYSIYHHWHSSIKTTADLPKKIFQRTKYFRPMSSSKRSGGSVFLSMEAGDIMEFHACFSEKNMAMNETSYLRSLFEKIAENTGTFVLWSMRPSWTNNGHLYEWSFGGDAILPSHHSIQTACTYYQGDIFSKRFNITFNDKKNQASKIFTSQATGAITRRLIFANLFQSMRQDGSLCLHPHLAPVQILMLLTANNTEDEMLAENLLNALKKNNIRGQLKKIQTTRQLSQENKRWYRLGIPLKLIIFGRKNHPKMRLVLVRNDTQQELMDMDYQQIPEMTTLALTDIINQHQNFSYKKYVTECLNIHDAKELLNQHKTVSMPLLMEPHCVSQIESFKKGEVLGFYLDEKSSKCLITNQETQVRAWVSRRI